MRKHTRLLALGLALILGLTALTGCKSADYAIKVGDLEISENDYYRSALQLKENYVYSLAQEETAALWVEELDDGSTRSEAFVDYINDYLADGKLYVLQFEKLGLELGETVEQTIQTAIEEAVEGNGGMTAFNTLLEKSNYTYEEYVTEVYDSTKKSMVLEHYFGEEGETPTTEEDIKNYYNLHNARIKYVFIEKVDEETGELFPKEELEALEQTAKEVLDSARRESDTDNFDDLIGLYSDDTTSKGDGVTFSKNSGLDETFTDAVFALEMGEVTYLDTEDAHWIIKRYDGTTEDVFTATMQQSTLEQIRADEITALLSQWREETSIKVNKRITKKYRPEALLEE